MSDSAPTVADEAEASEAVVDTQDVVASESSTEKQGDKPVSMLEAMEKALGPKQAEDTPASEATGSDKSEDEPEAKAEGDESDELSEADLTKLKPKTQARIRNLTRAVNELKSEAEALRPYADEARSVRQYMQESGLSEEEANTLWRTGRALKQNPLEALAIIEPIYQKLQEITGRALPSDLQQQVQLGYITQQHAESLARAKAEADINGRRLQQVEVERQQRESAERERQTRSAVVDSVSKWESIKAKNDPDWKLKSSRLEDKVQLHILRNGYPTSPQDAVRISEELLKQVEREVGAPRRTAISPGPTAGASPRATEKPRSVQEAMERALRG